jgi:hypothetical protein
MTSILLRMLQVAAPPAGPYRQDLPVPDLPEGAEVTAPIGMEGEAVTAVTTPPIATPDGGRPAAEEGGDLVGDMAMPMGAPPVTGPAVLDLPRIRIPSEAAISPKSSSPAFDVLRANGYVWAGSAETPAAGHEADGVAGRNGGNGPGPGGPRPGRRRRRERRPKNPGSKT